MTNKPISEVIRDMREHAVHIIEIIEEFPEGNDDLLHAYDRADTLFGAENVKRLIDHIADLEQQNAELTRWREEYQAKLNAEHMRVGNQYQIRIADLKQQSGRGW
ncbi:MULTISPECIES: hypothetical protein [Symbiopectobacterium]|uniref:hypothetical protein n=1 Tax=Symbiopectobacterium TaxID=801 RepID=UPI001A2BAE73|nr:MULTISPECIES: hypothetical protein [Symbiopectobacterium]MBG6248357.1 hypothetical protein [Candidatus Symbiopectobacterium sp. PLON1]MBT9430268.1 hypothetical protein [Candidatus Symbiopectobacterium endolongispinus]